MRFLIVSQGHEKTVESIAEALDYLANNLNAMLAIHNDETGLNFSLMLLFVGETLTLDEIKVTRIL